MKVTALNCPNCGAPIPRETMKCEYCGANLILTSEGSLTYRKTITCSRCGSNNASGSWLCMSCGKVITDDIVFLKELQKRITFDQRRTRDNLPDKLRHKLELNEFIHYSYSLGPGSRTYYVITDKKLIKHQDTVFGKRFWEAPWSEIASISKPTPIYGGSKVIVTTFDGKEEKFEFFGIEPRFYQEVTNALTNYMHRKKDIRAQICFLSLS